MRYPIHKLGCPQCAHMQARRSNSAGFLVPYRSDLMGVVTGTLGTGHPVRRHSLLGP